MTELEQYLASEAAQGLFLEEGEFQIAVEKALEKLSRFALPNPGFWVLKLVQAAVAAGASQVQFKFLKREVRVGFPNAANWEARDVLAVVLSGSSPSDCAVRHLVSGLLGAANGFSQRVSWSCGQSRVVVDRTGPKFETEVADPDTVIVIATRPSSPPVSPCKFTSPVRYLLKQTAHEYKALTDHSRVCPIPVVVVGYRLPATYQVKIGDLPPKSDYDSEGAAGRSLMLAQVPVTRLKRPALGYPVDDLPLTPDNERRETMTTLRLPPRGTPVEGVLCIYSCLQRESRLNFVMDGVLLESDLLFSRYRIPALKHLLENKTDDLVLDLYLGVSWDDVDLTQFSVKDVDLSPVMRKVLSELARALRILRGDCFLPWKLSKEPPEVKRPMNPTVSDLVGAAMFSLFIPHIVVLGGVIGSVCLLTKPVQVVLGTTRLGQRWKEKAERRKEEERLAASQVLANRLDEIRQRLKSL